MLWHPSKPSRSKRTPPSGFIVPCTPTLGVHEDGYRIIARRSPAGVHLWTRNAVDMADRFLRIADAMVQLPVKSVMLDGEAVVMRQDGRQDFEALLTKAGAAGAAYFAFYALELDGEDLRPLVLQAHRSVLAKLLTKPPSGMALSEVIDEDGPIVFEHARRLGHRNPKSVGWCPPLGHQIPLTNAVGEPATYVQVLRC